MFNVGIMSFQIRLFRSPEHNNGLIIIGIGQVAPEAETVAIPEPDEGLYRVLKNVFQEAPEEASPHTAFLESVRKIILESLKDGTPQLKRVADVFGVGPRTLERRLNKAGVDFTSLIDDTRRRLAINLLVDSRNKLTDIAFAMGYSEVSAFNRAFKRWTNSTPAHFRRKSLNQR